MSTPRVLRSIALHLAYRLAALLVLAAGATGAMAQASDPPDRVAYLNHRQGTLSVSPSGDDSWYESVPNRPLTQGDRLWTDRGARAELYVGDIAIRMDEQTQLEIAELDDQRLRLTLPQGRVQLRLRSHPQAQQQRVELGTNNLAVVLRDAGDYRIVADPQADSTQVMVVQGSATVHGEHGQSQELGSRQQAVYTGRDLAPGGAALALPEDFDRWLAQRGQREEQSESARYLSREIPGYQQLDEHGEWQNDPTHGAVWYPSQVASDWAPYSDGSWAVVAPYGYTWIDRAPWGFAPFHYGRWTRIGTRWCWVPGPRHARPVYSPALVAFVGGSGSQLAVRGGRPAVGWFPLAPGERWRPAYRASERYIDRANRMLPPPPPAGTRPAPAYANRELPHAVTAVPVDRFGGGGPVGRRDFVRPPAQALASAPVSQRPPAPWWLSGPGRAPAGEDRRADGGYPGRRTQAAPPAVAAFAPPPSRSQYARDERRQRQPDPWRQRQSPQQPDELRRGQLFSQQQQRQQLEEAQRRGALQAQQRDQQMQMQRLQNDRDQQQWRQQQEIQRRSQQAQQDQFRQQNDNILLHQQQQQQQWLRRQQMDRDQREAQMRTLQQQQAQQQSLHQAQQQQAQREAAMRQQTEQQRLQFEQQRQQHQLERQQMDQRRQQHQMEQLQRQQQMELQRQQQQHHQQAMQRAAQEQVQRQAQIQQQQQQTQQQLQRQQQEMQMRAQQAQRERERPGENGGRYRDRQQR